MPPCRNVVLLLLLFVRIDGLLDATKSSGCLPVIDKLTTGSKIAFRGLTSLLRAEGLTDHSFERSLRWRGRFPKSVGSRCELCYDPATGRIKCP